MSKLTYRDIASKIKETFKDDLYDAAMELNKSEAKLGLGPIQLIESKDVNSDADYSNYAEDCSWVYHFVLHDVYVKFESTYSSYNGYDFDDGWGCMTHVTPKPVQVTQFVEVEEDKFVKLSFEDVKRIIESDNDILSAATGLESKYKSRLGQIKLVSQNVNFSNFVGLAGSSKIYVVYHIIEHDLYIQFNGFYSSYDGFVFDERSGLTQVYPIEKKVTVYE